MNTLTVFTGQQRRMAKRLLAGKVASMQGRKLEEDDWSEVYCKSKNIPLRQWSNLNIDIEFQGLGVELKMLRVPATGGKTITDFCGTTRMHPSSTRSIRIRDVERSAQVVMEEVFGQYADLIEQRTSRVREMSKYGVADMRFGWLLWESRLVEFLYFEEEMIAPDAQMFYARWKETPPQGGRKASKSLWVFEKRTDKKRYSVTTSAGIKIQPYFDVPLRDDPNLEHFRVQREEIDADTVRLWIARTTSDQLKERLGSTNREVVSQSIMRMVNEVGTVPETTKEELTRAVPIAVSREAFIALVRSRDIVSDEHGIQLLLRTLG